MDMKQIIAGRIADAAQASFENCALTVADVTAMLETPPDKKLGDYALPCFRLSKTLRKAPQMIASALAEKMSGEEIDRVEVVGGYMNIFVSRGSLAEGIVKAVLANPGRWGSSEVGKGKTVCLDYSSINIAKRFHIGHLSTTMIGHSLKRIYDFNGYTTVGINHLGDWGTQFGKMICAYKKWGNREEVEAGGVQAMVDLYVRFHAEAEKDPSLEDEGRAWFKKIEDGDPEAMEIFSWFKEVTLKDTQRVYDLLGVSFDSYNGEAFYNDKMGPVVDELREKGLLVESQGAQVVQLEEYGMPPALVLRSDGATLYITRDLAAAFYRHNTYHFDKCLYVVAYQQNLHFKQLFKILELMGHDWYKGMEHVSFGMVSYEGRALSTREGYVVYLEDLLNKAIEKAREIIEEKSPNLPNKDEVARQVGVGAVVYFDLHNERIKDIDFRWERALSFEGETGPYVQYTHARCCSVLRKAQAYADVEPDYSVLCDDEALDVLMLISRFPEVVRKAMDQNEPSLITRHTTSLAQAYNKYYFEHRIMEENDPAGSAARVNLTDAV
ncbi:MAG: arginine--tRNA ligase, partial [Candidatus Ventricola sp.]|nr:arginine--tRNA ligase [Candidatus Ventricola sp.]MDY3832433.1 arginine--tRNA ligase [Candidatus Ventricola sp.]